MAALTEILAAQPFWFWAGLAAALLAVEAATGTGWLLWPASSAGVVALAALVHRFEYLKYALAIVLVFIGAKIFWNQIVGKVDPAISLGVTLSIIAAGIVFSLWKTRGVQPSTHS